jgi:hypothetical protein
MYELACSCRKKKQMIEHMPEAIYSLQNVNVLPKNELRKQSSSYKSPHTPLLIDSIQQLLRNRLPLRPL